MKNIKLIYILFILLLIYPAKAHAQTQEQILSFKDNITVNADSSVNVRETINYYFSPARHGIIRYLPNRYKDDTNGKYFSTPIEIISVTNEKNTPYKFSSTQDANNLKLQIGDPDTLVVGNYTYVISYKVTGIINNFSDHDELYYNVTGDKWDVPINNVSANVVLPGVVDKSKITNKCFTGSTGSTQQNCTYNNQTFTSVNGPLTIVLGWNKGVVSETTRVYEASFRFESLWVWLLPLFILIYFIFLYLKNGRDPKGRVTIVPEFSPPNNMRPAEMGTLIDEKADNTDISATLIDLAVRGYLKIEEKDKKFSLIKFKPAGADLNSYEEKLFNSIFDTSTEKVSLEDIKSNDFAKTISEIKDLLYDSVVAMGYFVKNPNTIRKRFLTAGIIIGFVGFPLFSLSFNLGGAVIVSGLIILIFSRSMPKKTQEGVLAKEKSLGFKEFLYRADRFKLQWQEKEKIFEKFLPYAIVFGVANEWAKNFKDIYNNPPDWYTSDAGTFNTVLFASSLHSFGSTASSSFSPPAASGSSGFGGGGFSGGGFGGGGGGSW
jgi:uncharacterized membrane protein